MDMNFAASLIDRLVRRSTDKYDAFGTIRAVTVSNCGSTIYLFIETLADKSLVRLEYTAVTLLPLPRIK